MTPPSPAPRQTQHPITLQVAASGRRKPSAVFCRAPQGRHCCLMLKTAVQTSQKFMHSPCQKTAGGPFTECRAYKKPARPPNLAHLAILGNSRHGCNRQASAVYLLIIIIITITCVLVRCGDLFRCIQRQRNACKQRSGRPESSWGQHVPAGSDKPATAAVLVAAALPRQWHEPSST